MSTISADLVKELRERTGAGMMECKKALVEVNGDIENAIELMRKTGQAKAAKKAGRVAAEGLIVIQVASNGKEAAMSEINCETDFVARDGNFIEFANAVTVKVMDTKTDDLSALANATLSTHTVEQTRQELISKIGENINVRRVVYLKSDNVIGSYIHGSRIGVLVELKGGDAALAKDIAMHIAATNPIAINPSEVAKDVVEKEREIALAQAQTSGKPQAIIDKMVDGRVNKFLSEVTLVGQAFVKDPNTTVEKLLQQAKAQVVKFIRFEVGEGIEKQTSDFVAEVMAQARGA